MWPPFVDMKGKKLTLKDLMRGPYEWEGDDLLTGAFTWTCRLGDFISLPASGLIK